MSRADSQILVVDDERFFREAIRDLLGEEGIETVLAENAAEALERAEDPAIGVMVLDINLPDRSGLDVLRELRDRRPEIRVVVLSAHTEQEFVLEALRLGAFDYLAKPLHEEEVKLSVRRALESYQLAANWSALRGRLGALASEVEALVGRSREDEPDELASRAADAVARLLGATKTSVLLREDGSDRLRVAAAVGRKLPAAELDPVPIGEGVAGRAVADGLPVVVEKRDPAAGYPVPPEDRYEGESFVVTPLGVGPERFGALCATDRRGGAAFAEDDVVLMRLLGLAVSPLLGGARPVPAPEVPAPEELDEPREDADAELARAVCDVVTREVEPERVLGGALRAVCERLGASSASVYLLDAEADALARDSQWEGDGAGDRESLPRDRGLSAAVFESGQPVATDAPADDPRFDAEVDTPQGGEVGPLLVLPIQFRGKTLGVFRAFPGAPGRATPRTAEVLGAAVSAAVRNVLLYRSLLESIEEVAEARRGAREVG